MSQVAVIGRREEAMCFLAAGYAVYEASAHGEALKALEQADKDGCEIIFLTPEFSAIAEETEELYGERITPAVIPLPTGGSDMSTIGMSLLKKYVERAVGADIIFRDEK